MQVHEHPAITINNHTYHGDFNGKDISHALCASFKDRPDICKQDAFESLKGASVDYDITSSMVTILSQMKPDTTERDLIIAGVFLVILNIGMVYIHKKRITTTSKSEIQLEVNQAVAQYFALRGDEPTQVQNGDM